MPEVEQVARIAPDWINRVTASRSVSWRQKVVAAALYRAVRDERERGELATISGVARESGAGSRRAVQRAIEALTAAGWLERRQGRFYLVLRPEARPEPPPGSSSHDCPDCDGTGWREIPEPSRVLATRPGDLAAPEQPWVVRCARCGGSGRRPGPEPAPEPADIEYRGGERS